MKKPPHPNLPQGIPNVVLPEPVQLHFNAGDMLIAHYQLGHSVSINLFHSICYAIFFKINHIYYAQRGLKIMTDIWKEWENIKT